MTLRIFSSLVALSAVACVVRSAPPPANPPTQHQPPVTDRTPPPKNPHTPPPTRPDARPQPDAKPPAGHCSPSAPELYVYTDRKADASVDDETLIIRASGHWTLTRPSEQTRKVESGCIPAATLNQLSQQLAATDFSMPPPAPACKAMPTRFFTFADVPRKRSAKSGSPCGPHVRPEVMDLAVKMRAASIGAKPAAPTRPTPPATGLMCQPKGAPIYKHETAPLRDRNGTRDKTAVQAALKTMVEIYRTGYYRRFTPAGVSAKCLGKLELGKLNQHIRDAKMVRNSSRIRCRALPSMFNRLTTSKGSYSWSSPCGADSPDQSTGRLVQVANQLTVLRP